LLAGRGFDEDKCQLRASALTFYSMLSIVPILAMIFGVAKGFGFQATLEKQLVENFADHEEVLGPVMTFANALLDNTRGGLIAGIGVVLLFWTVMKVLGNIEHSFNDIWEIKRPRAMVRKFSDYLSIMLIAPLLMLLSGSLTIYVTTQITHIMDSIQYLNYFEDLVAFGLRFIPYTLVWLLFTFMYIVMPNTKVDIRSAIFAGIIAGTCFQLVEWGYINFQIGVGRYNAIYGSFAALPLFLIWLQISWLVVLFGAELSFAHQNVDRYELEIDASQVTFEKKQLLTILVAHLFVKRFARGEPAYATREVADELDIPIRVVRQVIFELMEIGVISEIKTEDPKIVAYQPARSIEFLSIKYIIDKLNSQGIDEIPEGNSPVLQEIKQSLAEFKDIIGKSKSNKLLKDL
jgi:membrane protein